jgi:hypothetical protein
VATPLLAAAGATPVLSTALLLVATSRELTPALAGATALIAGAAALAMTAPSAR